MTSAEIDGLAPTPAVAELSARLIGRWPAHAKYLAKSLEGRAAPVMAVSEQLALAVLALGAAAPGGLDQLIDDYQFLCEKIVLPEEIHFRRHGVYRLSQFADAQRECYANPAFMNRYMNGLLVSGVMWSNHAHAFAAYVNDYLPRLAAGAAHLEIGPGHGLFLLFAARLGRLGHIEAWDISATSIANTRAALNDLGVKRPVTLREIDLFDAAAAPGAAFDSIVMSEILEHLEDPVAALRAAASRLQPGGLLWVDVPANSPAPDHIFLVQGLGHACELVETAGLTILSAEAFPMTGVTLEQAVKRRQAVSCVITARRPWL